ncbi:uncharacterized protein LOC129600041 [Paramacrobiotus metropolitanus]|uniref:uncharacterized protein LOC129600041 n=1 Tax=Paramacrobiotus metropolitanus TaxID=2943436 RepID=UPI0024456AA2|nr:uncharacterized protein LOC129600041 [Paramacrobiotus metropolitanus]XP_055354406.1 uncharacterized protein LOC129600041 [Paramacrobiotus metropolitanus]XP_055354407.1 uncharacterized protein LOC129600041 [Paramacrobiotus metropolitanus]XP_055354408.1 uncharacterized protein LOC129600041 [Paramacrobiotus metropolitanus]
MADGALLKSSVSLRPITSVFKFPVELFEKTSQQSSTTYTATVKFAVTDAEKHFGIPTVSWRVTLMTNTTPNTAFYKIVPACSKELLVSEMPLRIECSVSGTGAQYGDAYEITIDPKGWADVMVNRTDLSSRSLSMLLQSISYDYYGTERYVLYEGSVIYVRVVFYPANSDHEFLPAYQHRLVTRIGALLESGKVADCKLVSRDEQQFTAHRAILAAQSSVFAAMFENEMKEKLTGECVLKDIDGPVLQALLKFAYSCATSQLPPASLPQLYDAADKYDMDDLRVHCEKKMIDAIDVENAMHYLVFAKERGLQDLKFTAAKFIGEHASDI